MRRLCGILLLCLVPAIASHCPSHVSSRIQECVRPVAEYAKLLNSDQDRGNPRASNADLGTAFSLPNMGRRVFNGLCKLIAKFNVCVREYRMQCLRHVTISIIDSSYGYLCNEGYNTFMESAECLMELDRKPEVKRCHDETLLEIETANVETGIAMTEKLDRMCGALNFFAGCVKSPIKHECGSSAWQVIYRVLKDTTNTLMPGCQFTGTSAKLLTTQVHDVPSPSTVTSQAPPITTTTSSTSTTSVMVVDEFRQQMASERASSSRKGMKKNIVSEELSQLNAASRAITFLLLFIVMIF